MGGIIRKVIEARSFVRTLVIPQEMLINPPVSKKYDSQYVFIPKEGDWSQVQKWIEKALWQ